MNMLLNPNDEKRDQILRFLYERHKTSRGVAKIPIGIRDLKRVMKQRYGMSQNEVSSNLDYLVQVGWIKEVIKERSIMTKTGMELSQEQIKYKISEIGITYLESATVFGKPEVSTNVNITNIQGVTIVGDGNVVNTQFTNLFRALDLFDKEISKNNRLDDEQKLDAAGDLSTIKTQIAKKNPNKTIIKAAWESLKAIATLAGVSQAAQQVGTLTDSIIN